MLLPEDFPEMNLHAGQQLKMGQALI